MKNMTRYIITTAILLIEWLISSQKDILCKFQHLLHIFDNKIIDRDKSKKYYKNKIKKKISCNKSVYTD